MRILAANRLETRFVITVGIALLLFSAIAGIFTYGYSYRSQLKLAEVLQQQLVHTVQAQAEVAAFASNREIGYGVLEGLVGNPIILAARIEVADRFKIELSTRKKVSFTSGKVYPLFSPVDQVERIGALVVVQNDDQINTVATEAAIYQTLLMLAQVITGASIMAAVLRVLVIHPITSLAQAIVAIQPGSATRLKIEDKHAHDEIGLLSMSANALLETAEGAIYALKHQNGLFSSLLKNLPLGVLMVEAPSGKLLMANEAAYTLLGQTVLPDITGVNFLDNYKTYKVGSREPYPADEMPIVLGMRGVTSHVDDLMIERPDGSLTLLEIFGSPVMDDQGQVWASLVSFSDITDRRQMEDQVRQLAFHDTLTNLPNRRLLSDSLKRAIVASKRSRKYSALLFFDLDNFKLLNDTHGHEVGDLLLIEAANRLKHCVRESDTLARFGGDEFVAMTNDLDADEFDARTHAGLFAEKIRASLATTYVLTVTREGQSKMTFEHRCTASIGVVLFQDYQAGSEDLLKCADIAMYQAKVAGGDT
ncbi:MAG: diguanylate cyclase, partial [Herminiimonas sp.]|nr:diguanylate cyclase [Herminiimonas sp.]